MEMLNCKLNDDEHKLVRTTKCQEFIYITLFLESYTEIPLNLLNATTNAFGSKMYTPLLQKKIISQTPVLCRTTTKKTAIEFLILLTRQHLRRVQILSNNLWPLMMQHQKSFVPRVIVLSPPN